MKVEDMKIGHAYEMIYDWKEFGKHKFQFIYLGRHNICRERFEFKCIKDFDTGNYKVEPGTRAACGIKNIIKIIREIPEEEYIFELI